MSEHLLSVAIIIGTVIVYLGAKYLYEKFMTPLFLPVIVVTTITILIITPFHISYETYMEGGKWIHLFLGPGVVALAYPLYLNRDILKRLALPLIIGTLTGSVVGVVTGVGLAVIVGAEPLLLYSLAAKSVTTPVAMEITTTLGGIDSLAAVFVMIAGISGIVLAPYLFKWFRLKAPIGRGVGLGSASHVIGTTKALESSILEGSISTIAMILSAVFVSILAPYLINMFIP